MPGRPDQSLCRNVSEIARAMDILVPPAPQGDRGSMARLLAIRSLSGYFEPRLDGCAQSPNLDGAGALAHRRSKIDLSQYIAPIGAYHHTSVGMGARKGRRTMLEA